MKKEGLRVLTYNIHKGFNMSNQRFILHQIREALIHADADLLFLQEMQGKHDRHEKNIAQWPDQSEAVIESLKKTALRKSQSSQALSERMVNLESGHSKTTE